MRKIIVYIVISLAGYGNGLGNDVSVMFLMMGDVFDSYNAKLLRTADLQLMGMRSFDLLHSFWPGWQKPLLARGDDPQRELSQAGQAVKGIVVSDTMEGKCQGLRILRCQETYS